LKLENLRRARKAGRFTSEHLLATQKNPSRRCLPGLFPAAHQITAHQTIMHPLIADTRRLAAHLIAASGRSMRHCAFVSSF